MTMVAEPRTRIGVTSDRTGLRPQGIPEISVVMPCLNEASSVADCVQKARRVIEDCGVCGEVIVCDNGSSDGSALLAEAAGAHVVYEERRGYGSAYLRGLREARGDYIIMADADGTYPFDLIPEFISRLREGYDLVMGARQVEGDASPFLHRYVGVPLLTGFLNLVAGGKVSDAHCGMRGLTRDAMLKLNLSTTGMEFASEMIVKAIRARMKIAEIPIPYHVRVGESKLRTFRDGWRHLRFLLLESPTFLFLVPGIFMMLAGILALAILTPGRLYIGSVSFDFHYMVVAAMLSILGWQVITLGLIAKVVAVLQGSLRPDRFIARFMKSFSLEKTLLWAGVAAAIGTALLIWVVIAWIQQGFGFDQEIMLRPALFGMTLVVIGVGCGFSAFFLSALMLERYGGGYFTGDSKGLVSELKAG